jgi:hypothetical protein
MNPVPVALIALLLSLVAIGSLLFGDRAPEAAQAADPAPSAGPSAADLMVRIDGIAAENQELRLELDQLAMTLSLQEAVAKRTPVGQGPLAEAELDSLVEQVRTSLEAQPAKDIALPTDFAEQVASTLATIKHEEATRKADARQVSRSDRLTEHMPDAVQKLGLSTSQESDLFGAINDWYTAEAQMTTMWSEGVDNEQLGTFKQESYGAFETSLGSILSTQQLTDYETLDGNTFPGAGLGGK